MSLLNTVILNNPLLRWLLALAITVGIISAFSLWRWLLRRRRKPLMIRTNTFFDELGPVLVNNTAAPIVALLAIYAGSLVLSVEPFARLWFRSAAVILTLIQVGIWGRALLDRWVARYEERNRENNVAGVGTVRLLSILIRFALYALVALLILDNLPGVEITPLLAGLGIGGVAVALATQNILSDIFASLSITLDKPFVLGDVIGVGDDMGTVEHIGLKTTRVRSLAGEQLVYANNSLLNSRIRNFARMEQRRVVFSFRVSYSTPPEHLRAIPATVRSLFADFEDVRFDRAHLLRFDDLGLFYEVVYTVLTAEFDRYADIQHAVNLALAEHFAAAEIRFATLIEDSSGDRRAHGADGATP